MTKDKPKSPFADVGDEADWDKALDAWEMGDDKPAPAPQPPDPAPSPATKPATTAAVSTVPAPTGAATTSARAPSSAVGGATASSAAAPTISGSAAGPKTTGKPLYNPRSAQSLPAQGAASPKSGERRAADARDGADEQRSGAGHTQDPAPRISSPVSQGTGLGQALRTDPLRHKSQPLELPVVFSEASPSDGLLDALLDHRAHEHSTSSRPDEPSVVTSAPKVDVHRGMIPEAERRAAKRLDADTVAEGGFFDPFAEQPSGDPNDERKQTVRPGAVVHPSNAPPEDASSNITPQIPPHGPPQAVSIPRPGGTVEKALGRSRLPNFSVLDAQPETEDEPTVIKASPLRLSGAAPPRAGGPAAGPGGRPAPAREGGEPHTVDAPSPASPGSPPRAASVRPPSVRPGSLRPPSLSQGRPGAPRPGDPAARIASPPPQAIRLDRLPSDTADDLDRGQEALFEQMERSFGPSEHDTPGIRVTARKPTSPPNPGTAPGHAPAKPAAASGASAALPGASPRSGKSAAPGAMPTASFTGPAPSAGLSMFGGPSFRAARAASAPPLPGAAPLPSAAPGAVPPPGAAPLPSAAHSPGAAPLPSAAPGAASLPRGAPLSGAASSGRDSASTRRTAASIAPPTASPIRPSGTTNQARTGSSPTGPSAEHAASGAARHGDTWLSDSDRPSSEGWPSTARTSPDASKLRATPSRDKAISTEAGASRESGAPPDEASSVPADSSPSVSTDDAPSVIATTSETDDLALDSLVLDPEEVESWRQRATWLEAEAVASGDRAVRARGMLFASELWAIVGDERRGQELATQARDLTPNPLTQRQARAWAVRNAEWQEVLEGLQAEFRAANSPPSRAHAAHFAAEIARIALHDDELAAKKIEQAGRAWSVDARAYVWRIAEALTHDGPVPKQRFPEGAELQAISDALAKLQAWRGAEAVATDGGPGSIEALLGARAALSAGDLGALANHLEVLGATSGLREPATWLMVAISLSRAEERSQAASLLNALTSGPSGTLAYRALAALAIDRGDADMALQVLGEAPDGTFDMATKVSIAALANAMPGSLGETLQSLAGEPEFRALAAGARAAFGKAIAASDDALDPQPQDSALRSPSLRLGRLLGEGAPTEALETALSSGGQGGAQGILASVLGIELDLEANRVQAVAEKLAAAPQSESNGEEQARDRALIAALLHELIRDIGAARRLYESARRFDPTFEAATRAQMACSDSAERPALLLEQESSTADTTQAALLIVEAALSGTDPDTYAELLTRAHRKAPTIPFAAWLSERRARARGEFDTMVGWLRDRREVTSDAVEAAHDRVREALLIADEDPSLARQLLEQATSARPDDLAMRELYERLSPEQASDWLAYWTAQAAQETGQDRARTELMLALEYERTGEYDLAASAARAAVGANDEPFARLSLDRMEWRGPRVPDVTERLLTQIRASDSADERIELYQKLAALDESGHSGESSVPWYQAILEERPGHLPSLCRLEHMFISDGRDDDLVPIATEIAKVAPAAEAMAHAELAARFVARGAAWQTTRPIIEMAFDRPESSLWALREMEAHAVFSDDAQRLVAASRRLAERTIRPLEVATLSLRAAEASIRLEDQTTARELLERTIELDPANLVAERAMADLCMQTGDAKRAAEAKEMLAEHCIVAEHQTAAWFDAAVLWLDRAGDIARGRVALERVAELDLTFQDAFTRLQAIYVAASDREALAELLEKRLALAKDDSERVELEVVRGRTLAEMGDREAAKRALAVALEQSPDHVNALSAFADVCGREEDWSGAEQAYIRLVRLTADPNEQADIYRKLGEIYDQHEPNLERAELAYNEVLRRMPSDVHAQERLVDICERAGRRDRAIEMQQKLLHEAPGPEIKRQRTIELARVHERAGDTKRAESILEAARKEFPNDVEVLTALADFQKRAGRTSSVQMLLDRAAGDARRALSTGRFDVSLFSVLAAVARLRERSAAALIAEATVAALEGKPHDLRGAGIQPLDRSIDDLLAPEVLSPALRTLLAKSGQMLDAAAPVDLRALRAGPLTDSTVIDQIRDLAEPFGFESLEVFVSPVLGAVCVPIGSCPPQIVIGAPLVSVPPDDRARAFLVARTLKIVQARASALARSAPIELLPLVSAYLKTLAPDWQPIGMDAHKLQDLETRIRQARPAILDDDVGLLALEVTSSLGNRTSTLNTLVYNWGNRLALLWFGDLSLGFQSIARAAGHASGPAPNGHERLTWVGRSAEARDLAIFSVSDSYAEARSRLGV